MNCESMERATYPSDVSDDEWAFVAPYLTLMKEDAPQREHSLREVFNGLRYMVRSGGTWRMMPHDLPPWYTALDCGWGVRGHCRRFADGVARGGRPQRRPQCGYHGWTHSAIQSRKWCT